MRSLTCCPLATRPLRPGRQLNSRGHRDSTRNLRSGREWNRPPFIKVRRGSTGNTRSSVTCYCSHMPTLTRSGPLPTWQQPTQLLPGIHWGAHQWDYVWAAWQGGSPRPQPLAWEHANGSGRGTTTGLPSTGNPTMVHNPSASDSSAAEGNPSDRPPPSRSRGKRHRREAPTSSNKRRKTSHSPDWRSSSSSSESEDADSRGTRGRGGVGESNESRKVNSTFDRFVEEQTPNAFMPWPMKRQRRYYRTSKPLFAGPYAVPPGPVSLTLDKTSEPKK